MNINYPDNLPVSSYRHEIIELLAANQVLVIEGETGSGKTTQLPKMCLEFLGSDKKMIGCTQPRRIAAATVSARVREELGSLGGLVGYKIRFSDRTSPETRIKFMTDGILLAETANDPDLRAYDIIIVDEAHERNLNIDFILGYLKKLQSRRPELKIIITSATIDAQTFSNHFNHAPILSIEGKTYPVEVRYAPFASQETEQSYLEHCIKAVQEFRESEEPGDMLVFLPTEKDIRQCCESLGGSIKDAVILPLFGRLQGADQGKVFKSYHQPKIVVSTNVAETSVTVPGIRYVVDTGLARISQYNARAKTTSLPVTRISQAACDQRKGRCGRVGPGICLRLYSREDFASRDKFTLPEIKRANLANVILQMTRLNLGSPLDFPFVEAPRPQAVRDGERLLRELGAIDSSGRLTSKGKFMADIPIDPCISRIILEANQQGCLTEIQIIASALAIQDPRVRPAGQEHEAGLAHRKFHHPQSDFLTLLGIWQALQQEFDGGHSWGKLKKFCKGNFLSFQRMREWIDLHEQMGRILKARKKIRFNHEEAGYDQIHLALTAGYLRNIAQKTRDNLYRGPQGLELMIFPGSHLFKKSGDWIMAAAFMETSRLYAINVATIEPEWLEITGKHLCKYALTNPRWDKKSGQVIADETVSLFGLPIIGARRANYGRSPKHRSEARAIFIRSALLENNITGNYDFLQHNIRLIQKWQKAEDKTRRSDIIVDDMQLIDFYQERLPESVYNRPSLNRFLAKNRQGRRKLKMTEQDILARTPEKSELADYPSVIELGSLTLKISYKFSPGAEDDGMSIHIPAGLMPNLRPERFDWLVPGLLPQKLQVMLKGLPKSIRKHLVPLNLTIDRILDDIDFGRGGLHGALERSIFKFFKISVKRDDWPKMLPLHLTPRFVIYSQDRVIAVGRDLALLSQKTAGETTGESSLLAPDARAAELIEGHRGKVYRSWDFKELDAQIILYTKAGEAQGIIYPALCPKPDQGGVSVEFLESREQAARQNNIGMTFLYRLQFAAQYKSVRKHCLSCLAAPSAAYFFGSQKGKNKLAEDFIFFILSGIFGCHNGTIHSKEKFCQTVQEVKAEGFASLCNERLEKTVFRIKLSVETRRAIAKFHQLAKKNGGLDEKIFSGLNQTAEMFLPRNFHKIFTHKQVMDSDRLLQSLKIRTERAYANPAGEREKAAKYAVYLGNLDMLGRKDTSSACQQLIARYQTLVYEYHIALFAPELKTRQKVSPKILQKLWQEINHGC
ncbi:MAG: ATP-dependent RNA helicase HrpA [Deltaproteobacteria bacterium]|nr:MAG: ATP-dependent RNA helicase HrpA [Deltaproteobacteria bacterium]